MKNLKQLRLDNRLTQLALQMRTGIDQTLISKYERGAQLPSIGNLIVLADYFKVSIDYLLDRTDVKTQPPAAGS